MSGALTTPGAQASALVIDIGAGTIDVIGPESEVVAAGAGEMLTMAVAVTLGVPLAAADWVKRGSSVRVEAGQRYEAEDGTRGLPGATGGAGGDGHARGGRALRVCWRSTAGTRRPNGERCGSGSRRPCSPRT